jgi:hypothetical protein
MTLGLYAPAIGFDFIHLDDGVYVKYNRFVQDGISLNNVAHALVTTEVSYWHPLTWISHMLDCELFGMDAGGHHLVNVLIHTANGILLFWVLRLITGSTWKSFFVAAAFAWHPLGVETVAWISERKNLLCTLFWILTIWSHWRYAKCPSAKRNLLTALFLLLAFMAKPMAVTLPFVLLLVDVWPLKRFPKPIETDGTLSRQAGRLLLEKTTLFIITFFICILTVYAQKNAGAISDTTQLTILPRITNTFIAYASYLGKMVWPVDLAVLYPHTGQLRLGLAVLSALGLLVVTGVVLRLWKKQPWYAVGWFWYIGTLIPMIGLLQVGAQSMADRYTYVPLIGIFIMIAWGLGDLIRVRPILKPLAAAVCCLALVLCLLLTRLQLLYWRDSVTLFTHTLSVTEKNWKAHWAIGCAFHEKKQFGKSEAHLQEAILIEPDESILFLNLADSLSEQGKTEQAFEMLQKALQLDPDDAAVYYYLGRLYHAEKDFERALAHYRKAYNLVPGSREVTNSIAWLLSTCPDEAIRKGQEAVDLCGKLDSLKKPRAEHLCVLAAAYAEVGRFEEAVLTAEKALEKADRKKDTDLKEKILDCLKHYRQGQPYRDTSALIE